MSSWIAPPSSPRATVRLPKAAPMPSEDSLRQAMEAVQSVIAAHEQGFRKGLAPATAADATYRIAA